METSETKERDEMIHSAGRSLAKCLVDFYGKIVYNFHNGKYVNANIEQSVRPESEKAEQKI